MCNYILKVCKKAKQPKRKHVQNCPNNRLKVFEILKNFFQKSF